MRKSALRGIIKMGVFAIHSFLPILHMPVATFNLSRVPRLRVHRK